MSPVNDTFASGSLDGTVRMWDLRNPVCQGILRMKKDTRSFLGHSVATGYDPMGVIFAVALGENEIKLYDTRSYDKGPFSTFSLHAETELYWNSLSFSPDGTSILLTTPQGLILLDSFDGKLV